jgi:hypothetical protein
MPVASQGSAQAKQRGFFSRSPLPHLFASKSIIRFKFQPALKGKVESMTHEEVTLLFGGTTLQKHCFKPGMTVHI